MSNRNCDLPAINNACTGKPHTHSYFYASITDHERNHGPPQVGTGINIANCGPACFMLTNMMSLVAGEDYFLITEFHLLTRMEAVYPINTMNCMLHLCTTTASQAHQAPLHMMLLHTGICQLHVACCGPC